MGTEDIRYIFTLQLACYVLSVILSVSSVPRIYLFRISTFFDREFVICMAVLSFFVY